MASKLSSLLFVVMALALCFFSVTGSHGLIRYSDMGKELEALHQRNEFLEREIRSLKQKMAALRDSPFELERTAREDVGLARPDETVYIFSSPGTSAQ